MVREDQSPHQGGTLSSFATTGTTIPNDAGKMNIIPSVPRPDQRAENPGYENSGLGQPSTAFAADNATDLPLSTHDVGQTGEVQSGTGDSMLADIESKRTFMGTNIRGGVGEPRRTKYQNLNRSRFDRYVGEDKDLGETVDNVRNEQGS